MSEVKALHEEIAKLRDQLAERDARLVELAASEARLKVALLEIEQIKMQLAVLRRQRYGQSSERLDGEIVQLELRLEDLEETVGEQIAASPRSREAKGQERKPIGRKPLPPHLPREVVVHEPEIICQCGGCDPARLTKIGETTTEVLEKIPARLKVIRHVRPKYACRRCEAVFQAPAPELPIEKGRPGPGLLAHVASRNTATACLSIAKRAFWRARASISHAPCWPNGLGKSPGGSSPWRRGSASTSWLSR